MLMAYASVAAFFLVAIGFILGSHDRRPAHPAEQHVPREARDLRVRRGPGRSRVVQLQPAILHHRAHLHRVRRRDRVHLPGRHGLQALGGAGDARQPRRLTAFVEIFTFVAILLLGLVYVWVKGDLEWIRSIKGNPRGMQDVNSRVAHREPRVPPGGRARPRRSTKASSRKERSDELEPEPDGAPEGDRRQVRRRRRQRHHHQHRPGDQLAPQLGPRRTASGTCSSASPAAPSS